MNPRDELYGRCPKCGNLIQKCVCNRAPSSAMTPRDVPEVWKAGGKLTATSDYRSTPSREYRFFLYDPEGDGLMFFRAAEIRDQIAERVTSDYCTQQDGWSEEVGGVCAGEVTATATKVNVEKRPARDDFESDEDFEAAEDDYSGGDFDETCGYELRPLQNSALSTIAEMRERIAELEKTLQTRADECPECDGTNEMAGRCAQDGQAYAPGACPYCEDIRSALSRMPAPSPANKEAKP
jgi:hypothetical protein